MTLRKSSSRSSQQASDCSWYITLLELDQDFPPTPYATKRKNSTNFFLSNTLMRTRRNKTFPKGDQLSSSNIYNPQSETTLVKNTTSKFHLSQNRLHPSLHQADYTLSTFQVSPRQTSEALNRYLKDAASPIPESQFNHLEVTTAEIEAKARMCGILDSFSVEMAYLS